MAVDSWGVLNLRLQVYFIVKAVIQNKVTEKLCIYVLTDEVAMGHRNDERACVRPSVCLSPTVRCCSPLPGKVRTHFTTPWGLNVRIWWVSRNDSLLAYVGPILVLWRPKIKMVETSDFQLLFRKHMNRFSSSLGYTGIGLVFSSHSIWSSVGLISVVWWVNGLRWTEIDALIN